MYSELMSHYSVKFIVFWWENKYKVEQQVPVEGVFMLPGLEVTGEKMLCPCLAPHVRQHKVNVCQGK